MTRSASYVVTTVLPYLLVGMTVAALFDVAGLDSGTVWFLIVLVAAVLIVGQVLERRRRVG